MRFLCCFSKYSLCTASTVLTVPSESRVVLVNTSFVVHSDRQERLRNFWFKVRVCVSYKHISVFRSVFFGRGVFFG